MRRIFLLRHGKTEWNGQFRYQGKSDVPLNEEGRLQAQRAALRLTSLDIDAIYTSPLSRAKETAHIVSKTLGVPIKGFYEELCEMNFGAWEGLTAPDIERSYAESFRLWRRNPEKVKIPKGESFTEVVERVTCGMKKILNDDAGENILVVAHGGSIRAALAGLFVMDISASWRIRIDNCSLTSMELGSDRVMLAFANDTLHLLVDDEGLVPNLPVLI